VKGGIVAQKSEHARLGSGEERPAGYDVVAYLLRNGKWVTCDLQLVCVKSLGHQRPFADEKEKSGRSICRARVGIDQEVTFIGIQRGGVDPGVLFLQTGSEVKEMTLVREKVGIHVG